MARVPVENVGALGLIVDLPGYTLPQNAWSGALNVRFDNGLVKKTGGHEEVFASPPIPPFAVKEWFDGTSTYWFVLGTEKIYRTTTGTYTEHTRQKTVNIVSASIADPTVITVDATEDFPAGEEVVIVGDTTATPAINGTHVATVLTSTTFTIPVAVTVAGSDGTVTGNDNYDAGTWPIWSGGISQGVPIFGHNNATDYPQQWDAATSKMKDLDNWPANTYCNIIRPFKEYLIALDITKSTVRYPFLVKWSHPADPGAVPISWDETDPTKDAGEYPLGDSRGLVVDGKALGDSFVIYKEDAIWTMTQSGAPFIFTFHKVEATTGIFGIGCVAEFYRKHFVVTQDDIIIFDGTQVNSAVDRRTRKAFFNNVDSALVTKTFVLPNYPMQEMWICYVETGNPTGKLNRALVWNWADDTWTFRELPEIYRASYGRINETGATGGESFDSSSGTSFDNDVGEFGVRDPQPIEQNPLLCGVNGGNKLYRADSTYLFDTVAYTSYVERTGLTIVGQDRQGKIKLDQEVTKFVSGIWPKIKADPGAIIKISCGFQDTANGAIMWEGPYDFDPATEDHVNFTVSGKFIAVRFEESAGKYWELESYHLDIELLGRF